MDIPDKSARRQGYATEALGLFIQYLKGNGIKEIYTQTWSGNLRMIGLAHKLGFKETNRKCDIRMVRNEKYDGLTFKLIE
ncbi:GNAT family N-acetyltransferase [Hathewaya histolytica]|uniref:GNAT family N-acetyltransferase n=1 Tax=Hathewaya histolytica TaxID=1498 RepID=UPI003B67D7D8